MKSDSSEKLIVAQLIKKFMFTRSSAAVWCHWYRPACPVLSCHLPSYVYRPPEVFARVAQPPTVAAVGVVILRTTRCPCEIEQCDSRSQTASCPNCWRHQTVQRELCSLRRWSNTINLPRCFAWKVGCGTIQPCEITLRLTSDISIINNNRILFLFHQIKDDDDVWRMTRMREANTHSGWVVRLKEGDSVGHADSDRRIILKCILTYREYSVRVWIGCSTVWGPVGENFLTTWATVSF
jgi:hypothetical protein